MTYIKWLIERKTPMVDFTVENVAFLLEKLNKPQDRIKTIHISGTNGKGSLVFYLENALFLNNYKVGTFTSPYMTDINDSIEINGQKISNEDYENVLAKIYPIVLEMDKINKYVTGFEIQVAAAFLYFYEKKVDVAIIEVGMGGRFDATNVMKSPLLSAFTSISLDHANLLGKTLKEIAWNKGGIIKKSRPTFLYPQKEEVYKELKEIADENNSEIYKFDFSEINIINEDINGNEFSFREYKNVRTSLIGRHQAYNASLALSILSYLKNFFVLDDEKIRQGIYKTTNPARLEIISDKPLILMDGSHNEESINSLISNLDKFNYEKLILGFSILRDKEREKIIKKLAKYADTVVLTDIDSDRKSDINDLYNIFKSYTDKKIYMETDIEKAVNKTLKLASKKDLILWCGSLYLMKDIRHFLKNHK